MKALTRLTTALAFFVAPLALAGPAQAQIYDYGDYYDYYDEDEAYFEADEDATDFNEYGDIGYRYDGEYGDIAEWREWQVFHTPEPEDFDGGWFDGYYDDDWDYDYDVYDAGYYEDGYYDDDWYYDYYDYGWDWGW